MTFGESARMAKKTAPLYLCGWAGDPPGGCGCHPAIQRYGVKISGALPECTDLHVEAPRLPPAELRPYGPPDEASDIVRAGIIRAHKVQLVRATLHRHLHDIRVFRAPSGA